MRALNFLLVLALSSIVFASSHEQRSFEVGKFSLELGDSPELVTDEGAERDAGTLPDSALYQLDLFVEEARIFLIFDPLAKAKARIEQSRERLSEARTLIKKDKQGLASVALDKHNVALGKARGHLKEAKVKGDENDLDESAKVEEELSRREQVLQDIIKRFETDDNKNNDNALKGLRNALDKSKETREDVKVRVESVRKVGVEGKILSVEQVNKRLMKGAERNG